MCDVAKGYVIGMTYNNNNNNDKKIMHQLKGNENKKEKKTKIVNRKSFILQHQLHKILLRVHLCCLCLSVCVL